MMEPDNPPSVATTDERPVEQKERDEYCSVLLREGHLHAQRFPGLSRSTEALTYSSRYGYILRYARVERVAGPTGIEEEVNSIIVAYTKDGMAVHTVIDYSEHG
jgi:hypothetical protein